MEVEPFIVTGVVSAGVALVVRLFDSTTRQQRSLIDALQKRVDSMELVGRTLEIWREGAIAREQATKESMLDIKRVLDRVATMVDELSDRLANVGQRRNGGE